MESIATLAKMVKEFTDTLVDIKINIFCEVTERELPEPPRPDLLLYQPKHQRERSTICSHTFPRNPNCELCKRTKITRAAGRRNSQMPHAPRDQFRRCSCTAGHKILSKEGESRNNQRYAIVAQDLATQRIQSYPCMQNNNLHKITVRNQRTCLLSILKKIQRVKKLSGYNHTHVKKKLLRRHKVSLQKFLEPTWKPKVMNIFNGIVVRLHLIDLRRMELHEIAASEENQRRDFNYPLAVWIR